METGAACEVIIAAGKGGQASSWCLVGAVRGLHRKAGTYPVAQSTQYYRQKQNTDFEVGAIIKTFIMTHKY